MAVSHNEVETADGPLSGWGLPRPKKHIPEPMITPPETLEDVLQDHTFIDYGLLADYQQFHDKGLDHYGALGARLIKKLRIKGQPAPPQLQADLLVRFIMVKAQEAGSNPYGYISIYQMDHMTWELATADYTEGTDKQVAWEKLMRADRQRMERQTVRRHIRQLPPSAPTTHIAHAPRVAMPRS